MICKDCCSLRVEKEYNFFNAMKFLHFVLRNKSIYQEMIIDTVDYMFFMTAATITMIDKKNVSNLVFSFVVIISSDRDFILKINIFSKISG